MEVPVGAQKPVTTLTHSEAKPNPVPFAYVPPSHGVADEEPGGQKYPALQTMQEFEPVRV